MVSSEAAPFAKTGGLADVVGSLPLALRSCGDEVAVVLPRYGSIDLKNARRVWDNLAVHFGPASYPISIYQAPAEFPVYLVDCPPLFDRKGFYGESGLDYPDNHIRFAVFCRAALSVARVLFRTDIFHCHDWQTGLVPAYLRTTFATDPTFLGCRTLFTIHNLGYQGLFPKTALAEVALDPAVYRPDGMEFFGRVSYIKAGIEFADALNTVSPTYAREIQTPEFGFGLDGCLRDRTAVLSGILNGVDYTEWSPETDPLIPAHYSADDLRGKGDLQAATAGGIRPARGCDGPPAAGYRFALHPSEGDRPRGRDRGATGGGRCVSGGTWVGRSGVRGVLPPDAGGVSGTNRRDASVSTTAWRTVSRRGADIFLMPSHYEPCGLNQIYSLRYGTVPVVRATGGLDDTIEEGTGFKFAEYSGAGASRRGTSRGAGLRGPRRVAADDAARHGEGFFVENVVVGVLGAIPAPAARAESFGAFRILIVRY